MNIRDTKIEATLDNNYTTGLLSVNTEIVNYKWEKGYQSKKDSFNVEVLLQDAAGNIVYNDKTKDYKEALGKYKTHVEFKTTITNVKAGMLKRLISIHCTLP